MPHLYYIDQLQRRGIREGDGCPWHYGTAWARAAVRHGSAARVHASRPVYGCGVRSSASSSRDGDRGLLDIDRLDAFLPILFNGSNTNGLNCVVFFSTISRGLGTSLVSLSPQSPYSQLAHIHKLRK